MATTKFEVGEKDAAVVLRSKGESVTLEVMMPKGAEDGNVTQVEMCALYLAWAMEQDDVRSRYMHDMETQRASKKEAKK